MGHGTIRSARHDAAHMTSPHPHADGNDTRAFVLAPVQGT